MYVQQTLSGWVAGHCPDYITWATLRSLPPFMQAGLAALLQLGISSFVPACAAPILVPPRHTYFQPALHSACLAQIIDTSLETTVVLLSSCQMFSSSSCCASAWKCVLRVLIYPRKDFWMWYLSEDGKWNSDTSRSTTLTDAFEVWTLIWSTVLHILMWRLQHISFYDIYTGSLISGKPYLYDLRFGTGNLPGSRSYQSHQISGQASKYGILEHVEKPSFKPRGFANVPLALQKFQLAHIQVTHLPGQTYPSNGYLFQCCCKVVDTYLG